MSDKPTLTLSAGAAAPRAPEQPRLLLPGDPAPWFTAPSNVNDKFDFATAGGRYVVLSFFGSAGNPIGRALVDGFHAAAELFGDFNFYFFGVSVDPADKAVPHLATQRPGMDVFWDLDRAVSRLYGALDPKAGEDPRAAVRPVTYLLDPLLRVIGTFATPDGKLQAESVLNTLNRLPKLGPYRPSQPQAPVLVLSNIFERDFCRRLIEGYARHGGAESGYMVERAGKTVQEVNYGHKRRTDWIMDDNALIEGAHERLRRRLVPEIEKCFNFKVTRVERNLVACYDAAIGGYFRPHRDNTTKGTAHRRFAVTVNLNAEDYEGGNLVFPEFGRVVFRAPTGGAVVFSCSLLHEAQPVTKGRRFAFLPFLYDEAAARVRESNNQHLGAGLSAYSMDAGMRKAGVKPALPAGRARFKKPKRR